MGTTEGDASTMTIRLTIGCDPNHCDLESQAVAEWTCRKHSSLPVDITWLKLSRSPGDYGYGWQTSQWATSFSCLRWGLAEMFGFDGEYIYADSDTIFMADLAELWNEPFAPGKVAIAKGGGSWRYCVSKWSADRMKEHVWPLSRLRSDPESHHQMVRYFSARPNLTQAFKSRDWNVLDGEDYASLTDPRIGCIHYTAISTQPSTRHALPRLRAQGLSHWFDGQVKPHWRRDLVELFDVMLDEAKAHGYTPERYATAPRYGDFRKRSLKGYQAGPRAA
jgi:hypothetical protein